MTDALTPDPSPQAALRAGRSLRWLVFGCTFAAQSALLVLAPILSAVAADLRVSTATAGQLRSLSGLLAGSVALWVALWSRRRPLRDLLLAGAGTIFVGAALSAAAGSFAVLAAAQAIIGIGLGLLLPGATAAATSSVSDDAGRTLAWALAGQPTAWIVGMPLVGWVAQWSWRLTWLVVPVLAAGLVGIALWARPRDAPPPPPPSEPPLLAQPGARRWLAGELLAFGGWAGLLVFVGAIFVDLHDVPVSVVGLLLALAAVCYLPGNALARRLVDRHGPAILVAGATGSAVGVLAFGMRGTGAVAASAIFAALAFIGGARTLAGSRRGLLIAPHCQLQVMGFHTATIQYGYLVGAAVGGFALSRGGFSGLVLGLAGLHLVSATLYLLPIGHPRPRVARTPAG